MSVYPCSEANHQERIQSTILCGDDASNDQWQRPPGVQQKHHDSEPNQMTLKKNTLNACKYMHPHIALVKRGNQPCVNEFGTRLDFFSIVYFTIHSISAHILPSILNVPVWLLKSLLFSLLWLRCSSLVALFLYPMSTFHTDLEP